MPVKVILVAAFLLGSVFEDAFRSTPLPAPKAKLVTAGTGVKTTLPDTAALAFDRLVMDGEFHLGSKNYKTAQASFVLAAAYINTAHWEWKYARLYYQICYTQEKLGESQEVIKQLERQLSKFPAKDKDRFHLIILYWMKSKHYLALEQYQYLKRTNPTLALSVQQLLRGYGFELETQSP